VHIDGVGSALFAGVVIGTAAGVAMHSGFWIIFVLQIVIAALVVTLFSIGAQRR
jgi:hypothetical protein